MVNYSDEQILQLILEEYTKTRKYLYYHLFVYVRKGHLQSCSNLYLGRVSLRVRLDGEILELNLVCLKIAPKHMI